MGEPRHGWMHCTPTAPLPVSRRPTMSCPPPSPPPQFKGKCVSLIVLVLDCSTRFKRSGSKRGTNQDRDANSEDGKRLKRCARRQMPETPFPVNGMEYGRLCCTCNITGCVYREPQSTDRHTREASLEHLFRLQETLGVWQMALIAKRSRHVHTYTCKRHSVSERLH